MRLPRSESVLGQAARREHHGLSFRVRCKKHVSQGICNDAFQEVQGQTDR
jgi:hypothetical protein